MRAERIQIAGKQVVVFSLQQPGQQLQHPVFVFCVGVHDPLFGGTLFGVADKLEYLRELGVGCIYLCTIFKAYSNHKYDTGDYMTVDEMFGGETALLELIDKASGMGIKIVLTRLIGTEGIGLYSMIMPTFLLLNSIAQLGLPTALNILISTNKYNLIYTTLAVLGFIFGGVTSILTILRF